MNSVFEEVRGILSKKNAFKIIASIMMLFFVSVSVEYFWFGRVLHSLEESNKGISIIKNSDTEADGFIADENGAFVSQIENASLIISTQSKYINNLEVSLLNNPNFPIVITYTDPKTNQEIVLEKKVQNKMQKAKLNFLNYQVFNIQNSPEKITLQALNPQTTISEIKIDNNYHFNFYRFIFVLATVTLILIFVLFRKKIGTNPEYVFFAIALICGTLIVTAEPRAYVSWDELIHYKNSDSNSLKRIIKKDVSDIYASTNTVPFSYSIKEQTSMDEYFDGDTVKEVKKYKSKGFSFFNNSLREFYNQLGYIPSGVALMFGRLVNLPGHIIFMFGRWINVLLYASVVFLAIRKLKTGKMIMAVIALFPTAIFLASSYNYDSWVTAFTLLGLAYIFSELQQPEKKIAVKEMVIMIGALVIGLGPKAIYFPLLFLLFLFPKSEFASLKQYRKFMLASVFSILFVMGSFLIPFVIAGPGNGDHRGGADVNSASQVEFIFSEPLVYTKILLNFIKEYINPLNASGFITSFAYLGGMSGFMLVLATLLVSVFTDKNEYDTRTATLKVRLLIIGIYLATVALISTALYVAFTAVRSTTIAGVQPRYLIPLVFPLLFIIGSSRIKNPINRNVYNTIILGIMTFVLLQGIWDIFIKVYY